MIWYILYPFRGTTEAPVLSLNHPLRITFSRYGKWAARHVKSTLSISVAVAFILLYPLPYLYTTDATNFTNGASNLPHHVWTDAQPLAAKDSVEPDVIMRSIWVHGSFMQALERDVLLGALELQDELLGPTINFDPRQSANVTRIEDPQGDMIPRDRDAFHISNGLTDQSWFFHSPLQYWSGSADNISADKDIIATVNNRKTQSTSVNVTLRHSIVFSGKRFEERRLVAADAVVITLIHLRDSPIGRQWTRKATELAIRGRQKWTIIPADGQIMSSWLYEFQFRPVSTIDWIMLSIAYSLSLIFLVWNLSKLRAVKSKFGLIAAVLLQIAASIGSSFTVCAIFKLDLSKIPSYAYPLVVLTISMENSFRLIKTVMMSSSSLNVNTRIGEAFGETAHIAVANRAQNLLILWGLSKATYPGVAASCKFGAIAIMFDFFYLATFFLPVLSVDVRQRELSELVKASLKKNKRTHPQPQPQQNRQLLAEFWHQIEGGSLSTRLAGSIVCAGFVLIAGEHFARGTLFQRLNRFFISRGNEDTSSPGSSLLIDIHQARSPTSWLHLQDHETAREVINVVKPWAHSYIARVHDPLVFVLKGSDRVPHSKEPLFLPAVYDFVHHEMLRYLLLVVLVVGFVRLIISHLLDAKITAQDPNHPDNEPLLSVKTLRHGHSLDVVMMAASTDGHLVSVGLDRIIQIWNIRSEGRSRVMFDYRDDPFPVLAMAIDQESTWAAFLSTEKILLWNIPDQRWDRSISVDLGGSKPETMFFGSKRDGLIPPIVVVKRNGKMLEVNPGSATSSEYVACKTPLISAVSLATKATPTQALPDIAVVTASRKGCIHLVTQHATAWVSNDVKLTGQDEPDVQALVPISGFSMYLVVRTGSIDLVHLDTQDVIHTFRTEPLRPRSVRQLQASRGSQRSLQSFTLCYVNAETEELVLQTYTPAEGYDAICCCGRPGSASRSCCPWSETRENKRHIKNPGSWEALGNGCVLGVRKVQPQQRKEQSSPTTPTGLRLRGGHRSENRTAAQRDRCPWEVWAVNQLEEDQEIYEMRPLWTTEEDPLDGEHLMISGLGPISKLGTGTVAIGFGNVIKVISAGHEHFDNMPTRLTADNLMNLTNRRRKGTGLSRARGGPS
ncbi:hypothetical protein GQ53DRAFT_782051 [Thozetella sp. PMI_491]|nr:hypothetical protein GQ53DRAFT_782051 [Thozetella sp. PMI_491]